MNARIKKSAVILSAVFTAGYLIYCAFCLARIGNEYLPFWTDEITYLSDTNSFLETGDLGASIVFNETFSKIGGFGYHGFVYTLYDGVLAGLLGFDRNTNVVYVNALTFAFSFLLIALLPRIEWGEKIMLSALYCSNWIVSAYLFTYMQEIIQLPIAIAAAYLLFKCYTGEENPKAAPAIAFIVLILLVSLFRLNWIFWLVGLFPLLRNWKQTAVFGLGYVFLNLIAFIGYPQINAVYPAGFLHAVNAALAQGDYWYALVSMLRHFFQNALKYLSPTDDANWAYTLSNMLPLGGAALFLFAGDRAIKKFYFAVSLIVAANLFALFLFYDVHDWREVRMMAPIVYLIFAALVFTRSYRLILSVLALQLFFGVSGYRHTESVIAARQDMYRLYSQKSDLCRELDSLGSQMVTSGNPATVFLPSEEFYGDGKVETLCLPLRSAEGGGGNRIRYSVNLRRAETEFDAERVDYLLTKKPLSSGLIEEIRRTENFKLYKVRRSQVSQ